MTVGSDWAAMDNGRAGHVTIVDSELTGVNASIEVSSAAFGHNEPIPVQYTADGEGLSPPLKWRGVPINAEAVIVLVEDADSPTLRPLVHAIIWDLPGSDASLPEGRARIATSSRCSRWTSCRASSRNRAARSCSKRYADT
jgi:phosphatidylethanolamine-binding protein (PEBP) family uncharacterized protein